ncbi:MAG: energy transducer TonB [Prevotellaceae bacterium]|jgi:hypothetical protein|nr:energy transducer TonB [Prevotellaceae bacterium]
MRKIKPIGIAVCFLLTAIPINAQERRYELSEAKVAPGFYLAPNGYEYQLPQYGLTMTIPPQSYYKVPYLLKHNAYLVTNDSIVSYCLYKYYLSNNYTDFALYGSYTGNMRYRVAELKNNDRKEFLDGLQKKKDVRNHRSLRTPFATFTHYSAQNEAGEGRAHGYYYINNGILIEFIVIPKDDKELAACENIIKTLRKADLQNRLDDYLMMLATLQTAVPGEDIDVEVKEEEEVEVLYAQELATPTVVAQPSSPFAEPVPKSNTVNAEAAKNTSELAAMLRASRSGKQSVAEEEEAIEEVDVKIADATELVVYKDGYIKPPEVNLVIDAQPIAMPAYSSAVHQKSERVIEGFLLPIYSYVKRPEIQLAVVDVPVENLRFANNIQNVFSTSSARIERSLLAIMPVVKRPDISLDVDVPGQPVLLADASTKLNTSTATVEKTLVSSIAPVVKKPDVEIEVDNIETVAIPTAVAGRDFSASKTDAEKSLLAIKSVEKRPEVSLEVELSEVTLALDNSTSLNASTETVEKTLLAGITPVAKQPEVKVDDIELATVPVDLSSKDITTTSNTNVKKSLLAIAPVEKRPEVSLDVEIGANTLPVDEVRSGLNTSTEIAEKTLASITSVAKQAKPDAAINIASTTTPVESVDVVSVSEPIGNTQSSSVYVVTADVAEELLKKSQEEAEAAMYSQPKMVNLLDPPVIEERQGKKKPQVSIVDDIQYADIWSVRTRREVVNFNSGKSAANTALTANSNEATIEEPSVEEAQVQSTPEVSNKRERCSRSEDEITFAGVNEEIIPYSKVQQKPTFNGEDYNSFALWIGDNMCYPAGLRQELNGYVNVEIVITSDGSIGKVNVMNSPHKLLETEVLHMLSTSPKWAAGVQNGKPVPVSIVVGVPVSAYL